MLTYADEAFSRESEAAQRRFECCAMRCAALFEEPRLELCLLVAFGLYSHASFA